jgi:isoamylase
MARGTPMILCGDELGRTQQGNNNAYCQDNEISWLDWDLSKHNSGLVRFVQELVALRLRHPTLIVNHVLGTRSYEELFHEGLSYHGTRLDQPDWGAQSHNLAILYERVESDVRVYVIANAESIAMTFDLPPETHWKRIVDTAQPSPSDFIPEEQANTLIQSTCQVQAHSVAVLIEAMD